MSVGGKSGYSSGAAKRLIHTVLKLARVAQGQFEVGSVLAMSFHDASFDAALSFHVAMKAFGKPEGLLGRTGGYILAMGRVRRAPGSLTY